MRTDLFTVFKMASVECQIFLRIVLREFGCAPSLVMTMTFDISEFTRFTGSLVVSAKA